MIDPTFFASEEPVALAGWLIHEMNIGLLPVWPSTDRYADLMVEGLAVLSESRPFEVVAVLSTVPQDSVIDWPHRLSRLCFTI